MASFNRVLLMGNLTRDPQLKYLPSQTAVAEHRRTPHLRRNVETELVALLTARS